MTGFFVSTTRKFNHESQQENYNMKQSECESALLKMNHWNLFCISDTLRENKVEYNGRIEDLFELIPFGVVRKSIRIGNATPVCEWVMEHLGYNYDSELDKWIKING